MSLHAIAQELASRGRGGDTTLVHMTPGEVGGLQALALAHGGSLTTNPDTGLPEANFLKSILPMVAGAVLTGGMGLPALASAALVGGGTALASRDLGKGLMAGMGAFGGAGLGSALAGLGANAAGAGLAGQAITAPGTGAVATGAGSQAAMLAAQNAGFGAEGLGSLASAARGAYPGAASMGAGLQQAVQDPQSLVTALGGSKGAMRTGMMAGLPVLAGSMTPQEGVPQSASTVTQHPMLAPATYEYDPGQRDRFRRYAEGGVASLADNPYYTMSGESGDAFKYLMGQRATSPQLDAALAMPPYPTKVTGAKYEGLPQYTFDTTTGTFSPAAPSESSGTPSASGAPAAPTPMEDWMTRYADTSGGGAGMAAGGRLLDGPGDGVSDSIPASIDGERPARLATGEFVFDARTVSEIGNGDTKAGAKKLYAVMEAIHRKRASAERGKPSGADQQLRHLLA